MNFINLNKIPYLKNIKNLKFRYDKINNIIDSKSIIDCLKLTNQHFSNKEISTLFINKLSSIKIEFDKSLVDSDYLNQILALDYKTYMIDDILTKVDRATMSVSLEGREPLLDYRIIEYVAGLSGDLKYKNGIKKYLLKTITHKYLPKELMDRKKMGFGVPIFEWFKKELKDYFLDYLNENRLNREGIFNSKEIVKLRDKYFNNPKENVQRLWFILMFEMWYERWM
jgi:asparagine synthase (glutamine-hydrolysing)